ncbi:MAG: hypothetical protein LBL35_02895 [Clostridiales bacterium]|nr:hypothetical protein [Clostridiales bacterium]
MKEILGFDEVIRHDNECSATKTIPAAAVFFEGHYPKNPIYPGVLQLELAVSAAKLFLESMGYTDTAIKYIKKFRYVKKASPGQIATIKLKYVKDVEQGQEIDAAMLVEGERISYGTFVIGKKLEEPLEQFIYETKTQKIAMRYAEIGEYAPHRFPFAHIDGIIELIPGKTIKALKNVSSNDYVFWGEKPGTPFPPSLMIEVFAQGAGIVCDFSGLPLLGVLAGVNFLGNAYPGDQMIVDAYVVKSISGKTILAGGIKVGDHEIFSVENVICGEL